MGTGIGSLTRTQLAAVGRYMDVNFFWDDTQTSNLVFSVPYTDVDGTARVQPVLYINLAMLFEVSSGGSEDPGPDNAVMVSQESHDATFSALGALTAAQAQALKMRNIIWVDADPTGGSGLVGSMAGSPGTWVIVFPAFIGLAGGTVGGHTGGTPSGSGNIGSITVAQLAGVNRMTVNFVNIAGGNLVYSLTEGGPRNFVINLESLIVGNEIEQACH